MRELIDDQREFAQRERERARQRLRSSSPKTRDRVNWITKGEIDCRGERDCQERCIKE